MFIGEAACIFFYYLEKHPKSQKSNQNIQSQASSTRLMSKYEKIGKYGFCIVSALEFFTSMLKMISGIFITNTSIFSSISIFSTFFVLFYRVHYEKKTFFKHEKLGIFLYFFGIVLVFFAPLVYENYSFYDFKLLYSILVLLLAQIFDSFGLILTQKLIDKLETQSTLINFIKGITGLVLCMIFYEPINLLLMKIIKTPKNLYNSEYFAIFSIALTIDHCFYNYTMLLSVKSFGVLTICFTDTGILVLNSVYSAINNANRIYYCEIIGILFIMIGTLIFNEIIRIKCCGFEKDAEKAMKTTQLYLEEKQRKNTSNFTLFRSFI